jgi:PAS domain S-box-containing protein
MEQRLAEASARIAELEAVVQQHCPPPARPDGLTPPRTVANSQARAKQVLTDHKEQLQRFMHLLGMTNVFIRDLDNRVVYWTRGARRAYGFTAEQAMGRDCTDLLNIRFSEPIEQIRATLFQTGRWEGEMTCTRQDGQTIIIASEWLLYRDSQDQPAAILEAGTDITARKHAEEQLRELNQTLERQVAKRTAEAEQRAKQLQRLATELTQAEQRERQRIAQVLHDDLQQLLVGAKLQLHMLCSQLTGPQQQALAQINELLNQSLAVSRSLTSDLSPPILRDGKLAELMQYLAQSAAQKYGLHVHLHVRGYFGQPDRNVRELLFQAVREVLLNVVKHAGTNHAEMILGSFGSGHVQIVVADQGVGFQPTEYPAGTTSNPSGGGFGLFSIRERLMLLGGGMDIESRPGGGTRIILTAPCPPVRQHVCGCDT